MNFTALSTFPTRRGLCWLRGALLMLFCLAGAREGAAQLGVNIGMERRNYVSLEPVQVKVTITNTVGKNVVLGGPGNTSWLTFEVNKSGRPASVIRPVVVSPIVLRAGDSLERTFRLERHFFLSEPGSYTVRASAYFPELRRYNSSRTLSFTVQNLRPPRWEKAYVVPEGFSGAGKYRRYQISTFTDLSKSLLFLSVYDEETKMVMSRNPLSDVILDREIQPLVDANQNLHILHLGSPTVWVYHKVNPEGAVEERQFYRARGGQPKLVDNGDGTVAVTGAAVYDPNAPPPRMEFRSLSDRP